MSTRYLYNNLKKNQKNIPSNMWHEPIFTTKGPAFLQQDLDFVPFGTNESIKPGQSPNVDVDYGSAEIREEQHAGFIKIRVETSDDTNHPTFMQDCFSMVNFLEFKINEGNEKLTFQGHDVIHDILSDWIYEYVSPDMPVEQFLAKFRNEFATYTGVEVTNDAGVLFVLPVDPFLPFLKGVVVNGFLRKINAKIGFAPIPTDAHNASIICKSNTTSPAYTNAISFNDLAWVREYRIIKDGDTILRPKLEDVIIPIPQYDIDVKENIAWGTLNGCKDEWKLSDIAKRKNIHHIVEFLRKKETAYNSATCGQKLSGYKYIQHKIRQNFGERKELNFTYETKDHNRRLLNYEIESHLKRFGTCKPTELLTESTNLGKYYCHNTQIYFDDVTIQKGHNEVLNTLDSTVNDYTITTYCNQVLAGTYDLVRMVQYYDIYKWNSLNQLVKVSSG